MSACRSRVLGVGVSILCLAVAGSSLGVEQNGALTFFGWSDQHIQVDGNAEHLIAPIDAMNGLPGRSYPEALGGIVEEPAFVLGCGDLTEWPSNAAKNAYEGLVTKRLRFPTYDIAGNHDLGGLSPNDTVLKWLTHRHGGLRYTFERGGVTFVALFSEYDEKLNNPAQPISKEALAYLRTTLVKVPAGVPVVVATHLCFDAITNRDELVDAFGSANVILVLGGHYHKATVNRYRGFHFVQLPSPGPKSPTAFTVIRVTPDRLVAIPFNYHEKKWTADEREMLNIPIQGPARPVSGTTKESR